MEYEKKSIQFEITWSEDQKIFQTNKKYVKIIFVYILYYSAYNIYNKI